MKVTNAIPIPQNVSTKNKNHFENEEKTVEIKPSAARNTKSGKVETVDDDNLLDDINYVDDDDDYNADYSEEEREEDSDESYEFDEAENVQEAFEAKYYHNRKTSSTSKQNSYSNKFSLKKVNNLLANQNVMVVDKEQLSETLNNSNLLSHSDNQKNAETTTQQNSNNIDLTTLGDNNLLISNTSKTSEDKTNENETDKFNAEHDSNDDENDETINISNRKGSKKYENSKSFKYVTSDKEGMIKSRRTKHRRRVDGTNSKSDSNSNSNDQINLLNLIPGSSVPSSSAATAQSQTQSTSPSNRKTSVQISVDKKQIQICGPKGSPIKITDNKKLAIVINPSSVNESEIQELISSPVKSRSKNSKPPVPVICSSPYTRNHNRNKNRLRNGKKLDTINSASASENDLSAKTPSYGKNSAIAKSPLFAVTNAPLIDAKSYKYKNKGRNADQVTQESIDFKYNLLNEYNLKKSASPTDKSPLKQRFLKDEAELKKENQEQQLSKKERKALKKMQKNKRFDDEYEALNNTRKTYIVNGENEEVYQSIFTDVQNDSESETETVPVQSHTKKNHKKEKISRKQSSSSQITNEDEEEMEHHSRKNSKKNQKNQHQSSTNGNDEEHSGRKNSKKNQKLQQQEQQLEEELSNIPKKNKNRKNSKVNKNSSTVDDDDDNDVSTNRKHSKKNKHQELVFNIEDIDEEDDLFNITSKSSNSKNRKSRKTSRA